MRHTPRDWRKLGQCRKVIQHDLEGGTYTGAAISSEGLLAVTDNAHACVRLLNKEGELVRSIGNGLLSFWLFGVTFDRKGNVWVADTSNGKVLKLSQDGQLLHTIDHAGRKTDRFDHPICLSSSPEGQIYICDRDNHRVTVHNEEGEFLFVVGSKGSEPECFDQPRDVTFGSDGLVYVIDRGNKRVCVWSKEGRFQRDFKTKCDPTYMAATSDNHLLITSCTSSTVMVYTLRGQLVHEFGGRGSDPGRFTELYGICVDDCGAVYVADGGNCCLQIF